MKHKIKQEYHKVWGNTESLLQINLYHKLTVNSLKSIKTLHILLTYNQQISN